MLRLGVPACCQGRAHAGKDITYHLRWSRFTLADLHTQHTECADPHTAHCSLWRAGPTRPPARTSARRCASTRATPTRRTLWGSRVSLAGWSRGKQWMDGKRAEAQVHSSMAGGTAQPADR